MALSVAGYGDLASRIVRLANELCGGKLVMLLEGGYDLVAVPWAMRTVLEVMLGEEPAPDPLGLGRERAPDISGLLAELRRVQGLG